MRLQGNRNLLMFSMSELKTPPAFRAVAMHHNVAFFKWHLYTNCCAAVKMANSAQRDALLSMSDLNSYLG
jgi:hypothetical protein